MRWLVFVISSCSMFVKYVHTYTGWSKCNYLLFLKMSYWVLQIKKQAKKHECLLWLTIGSSAIVGIILCSNIISWLRNSSTPDIMNEDWYNKDWSGACSYRVFIYNHYNPKSGEDICGEDILIWTDFLKNQSLIYIYISIILHLHRPVCIYYIHTLKLNIL